MMVSFLPVGLIESKKSKEKQKKICFLLQRHKNSHKSCKKTRKKHQNDFLGCSLGPTQATVCYFFQPLEVVGRGSETQPQVVETYIKKFMEKKFEKYNSDVRRYLRRTTTCYNLIIMCPDNMCT